MIVFLAIGILALLVGLMGEVFNNKKGDKEETPD
jgi:Na+-transporting methylmalonyl-CoA/oxaloacetate decarboxylase gamma subunit